MRTQDIEIGGHYRHAGDPNYGWIKVLQILNPGQDENKNKFKVVKCEWTINKDDKFGFIKYFRLHHLVKP